MNIKYINIYNNLINLTRNKELYKSFDKQDTFEDRLILFLLHFAFFLKFFKDEKNKKTIQEIYDYIFRQLELSVREIGYGDQTINKRMKDYINLLYGIIDKIHYWEDLNLQQKKTILSNFTNQSSDCSFLVEYFDKYSINISNNTLNSHIKGVFNS